MKNICIFCLSLIVTLGIVFVAFTFDESNQPISLTNQLMASSQLQHLFTSKGKSGLTELTNNPDKMIALHAQWELAKENPDKADGFLTSFENLLSIHPPKWWQVSLKSIVIYNNNCHYISNIDIRDSTSTLNLIHDQYEIAVGSDEVENLFILGAGFPYPIKVMDRTSNNLIWNTEIWAVGRTSLDGIGFHKIEMLVSNDCLFVFGIESHGAYAEVFRLNNGTPIMRFCTCYWFNFSEAWNLK